MPSRLRKLVNGALAIFAATNATAQAKSEQALIVHFEHTGDWADFFAWEPTIESAVSGAGGDYDGNELAVDGHDGTIYMYGPSADTLLAAATPCLHAAVFLTKKIATLRYGDVKDRDAPTRKVPIEP